MVKEKKKKLMIFSLMHMKKKLMLCGDATLHYIQQGHGLVQNHTRLPWTVAHSATQSLIKNHRGWCAHLFDYLPLFIIEMHQ